MPDNSTIKLQYEDRDGFVWTACEICAHCVHFASEPSRPKYGYCHEPKSVLANFNRLRQTFGEGWVAEGGCPEPTNVTPTTGCAEWRRRVGAEHIIDVWSLPQEREETIPSSGDAAGE